MQTLIWNGAGAGTLSNPFILKSVTAFDQTKAFNINLKTNYLADTLEYTYFKINNNLTVYLLATLQFDRNRVMIYEAKKAINYTVFLTDKIDYIDGPYSVNFYNGIHYLVKLQIFDMKNRQEGAFTGPWVPNRQYFINDMVLYGNNLYITEFNQLSPTFVLEDWINVSAKNEEIKVSDIPPTSYGVNLWVKPLLTIEQGGVPITEDLTGEEMPPEEESIIGDIEVPPEEEDLIGDIEVPIEEEAGYTETELVVIEEPE